MLDRDGEVEFILQHVEDVTATRNGARVPAD
jgi:hypothetical protein